MRKILFLIIVLSAGLMVNAQKANLKPDLQSEQRLDKQLIGHELQNRPAIGRTYPVIPEVPFKATNVVSVINIGTSANAYGYANGGKSNVNLNNDLNVVTNFHRMGGPLDPGGYSGDVGYDISLDGGITWSNMNEVYEAQLNAGGQYFIDAARYPQHGLYNPPGNTDPAQAYIAHFCPTTSGANGGTWGGYAFGRGKIGDVSDTLRNFKDMDPSGSLFYYVPNGFTINKLGEMWVTDRNMDWSSGALVWTNQMLIIHGLWNNEIMDYEIEVIPWQCQTHPSAGPPSDTKVEFSPDGQIGYIAALTDIEEVPISLGTSLYPVLWRTEDGGATWSDPIPVAIAGVDGIEAVKNYLSDLEIAELYNPPLPARDEIPFTTAFDMDLSVDAWGNPHIVVVCGVTGSSSYSIVTGKSAASGYAFTAVFLLSSNDKGNEGSWEGHELSRLFAFRGNFGELSEDNRPQISRDQYGYKMFASWLDTDTTVSSENNAPDIWARGFDVFTKELTTNESGQNKATNVTFGSEGTFSAYYHGMANEVFHDGAGNYTIPFTYQGMNPADPIQPVQFKYIQDFSFQMVVSVEEKVLTRQEPIQVSQTVPNPASTNARFDITLDAPSIVSVKVTNMMGQVVKTLAASDYQKGTSQISIDISDLTSGVYFYTVEAGRNSVTKKMIVK